MKPRDTELTPVYKSGGQTTRAWSVFGDRNFTYVAHDAGLAVYHTRDDAENYGELVLLDDYQPGGPGSGVGVYADDDFVYMAFS